MFAMRTAGHDANSWDNRLGYHERDNGAYLRWDAVSRGGDTFLAWMGRNVLEPAGRQA
jgi:hypothetical protein